MGRAEDQFIDGTYRNTYGTRRFKLFVPAADRGTSQPLVVMLHGCTQTPDDFALATGMNELAKSHGFVAAYPAQSVAANRSKCWNWFRAADQQRGSGEPAIIAGLTQHLVEGYGLDAKRVYVAGLSAGAAMAVILGRTYPELYTAVGVHSGLPYAAAHDLTSAIAAMSGQAIVHAAEAISGRYMPAIVIHGDHDKVVHPINAQRLLEQFSADRYGQTPSAERRRIDYFPGGRSCTHTVLRDAVGTAVVEHWLVHGGGHAWFGGNPNDNQADVAGPDASREMLRFFLTHRLD